MTTITQAELAQMDSVGPASTQPGVFRRAFGAVGRFFWGVCEAYGEHIMLSFDWGAPVYIPSRRRRR